MKNSFLFIFFLFPFIIMGQFAINIPPASTSITQASTLDNEGNAYVSAVFGDGFSFDFDRGEDEFIIEPINTPYIASYDTMGNMRFAFVLEDLSPTPLGTFNYNTGQTLLVDDEQNIYLIGVMSGWVDFNPDPGVVNDLQTIDFGQNNGFIVSYDSEGNFRFLHDLGRTNNTKIYADVSPSGDVTLTYSLRGEVTIDNITFGEPNSGSYYLLNISSNGQFGWVYNFRTNPTFNTNTAARVQVDDSGNIYMMNLLFDNIDLDPGGEVVNLGVDTLDDDSYYIASYTPEGTFRYAHRLSENFQASFVHIYSFDVGDQEEVYVYGPFTGTVNFEAQGDFQLTSAVGSDMFLVSYDNNGNVNWGHSLGFSGTTTSNGSEARPLFSDILPSGKLLLCGWFTGDKDFDPSIDELFIERNGDFQNTFINVYNVDGNIESALGFLTQGNSGSIPFGINSNSNGEILINGFFADSVDFNPLDGEAILTDFESGNFLTLLNANFDFPTSVDLLVENPKYGVIVYPNPVRDIITINTTESLNSGLLRFVSLNGEVVFEKRFENLDDNTNSISLPRSIITGAYYLQVISNNRVFSKLVKVIR